MSEFHVYLIKSTIIITYVRDMLYRLERIQRVFVACKIEKIKRQKIHKKKKKIRFFSHKNGDITRVA